MINPVNILLVDNDHSKNSEREKIIKAHSLSGEVKIAMNAGHALLYLDHIHLNRKIQDTNLVVILTMNTPISNGYDFLNAYNHSPSLNKEKIHIIVVNDNLCEEKQSKIKKQGISDFICHTFPANTLKEFIEKRFNTQASVAPAPAATRKGQKNKNNNLQPQAASGRS